MTYPIYSRLSFRAAQIGEAVKHFFLFSQNNFVQNRHLTVCSSIAAAASHHHEGSSLIYGRLAVISLRPRVPSWIWIRWIQYATHRNNFTSPPKLAMLTAMQNHAPTPSYFTSWQHFLETFTILPETTKTTNSWWLQSFLSSNSKQDFCYTMANILPSYTQQCLNLTMYFSLRHLAAKILSPLYHNFILFPYFFPYYETCSINVNPLFHAAIKNLTASSSSCFFILLYFPTKLSEGITTRKNTFLR